MLRVDEQRFFFGPPCIPFLGATASPKRICYVEETKGTHNILLQILQQCAPVHSGIKCNWIINVGTNADVVLHQQKYDAALYSQAFTPPRPSSARRCFDIFNWQKPCGRSDLPTQKILVSRRNRRRFLIICEIPVTYK